MTTEISTDPVKQIFTTMNNPSKASISELEAVLATYPTIQPHVDHVFAKGAYMRCISMAKGTIITSKIHKTEHISVVVTGDVSISKADGTQIRVKAPHVFVTQPNTKRAIIVHEDTVWMTFHPTNETDLAKIEDEIIAKNYLDEEVN